MKGLDVFIVRFAPFVLYILFGLDLLLANLGIDISLTYFLHSQSVIYALCLFFISLSNNRYHCVYNRAMYVFLVIVPIFNYLDAKFNLVPVVETYITIVASAFGLTAIITAYLAIRHFIQMSKRRMDNGRE